MFFIVFMLWLYAVLSLLSIIVRPALIGRPRAPISPGEVAAGSIGNVIVIAVTVIAALALAQAYL